MKDSFDKGTEEFSLPAKRKPGRPGKQVNEDNFHHVLNYFLARQPCKELWDIDSLAPAEYRCRPFVMQKIAREERFLGQMRKMESAAPEVNRSGMPVNFSVPTDQIAQVEERIANMKSSIIDISPDLIERLQIWINEHASKKDWVRCLNLMARKKADRDTAKSGISVSEKVFKYLKRMKDGEGDIAWDDFLLNMAVAYQEAKKR